MNKKAVIIIIVVAVLAIAVAGYFIWKKSQKEDDDEVDGSDKASAPVPTILDAVKANLGANTKWYKGPVLSAKFGENYEAHFYKTGRIFIFDGGKIIRRGNFSNGGNTLVMDNGVTVESGSVWANLKNAIK